MKKIIIAGGTGFIGQTLIEHFQKDYVVIVLSRNHIKDTAKVKYIKWDGQNILAPTHVFENAHALINLCGKSVNCRYTDKNKQEIYDSRIKSVLALGKLIDNLEFPPQAWLTTVSGTIYKYSMDKAHTENNCEFGNGFSVDVCHKWEGTINNIAIPQTRKILLRTSIVLGKNGGALTPILKATKLGLGGKQGSGQQKISWIHEEDLSRMIKFLIEKPNLTVEFNASSPNPENNADFMKQIRKTWKIPFGIPAPKWALHLVKYIIGTEPELALKSRFLLPEKALKAGFQFNYPQLSNALKEIKNRRKTKNLTAPTWG